MISILKILFKYLLNVYKTDTSYKGKHIWTVFDIKKTFICKAFNRLTKNKCGLQREVHRTLEIAQTLGLMHAESCTTMFLCFCG